MPHADTVTKRIIGSDDGFDRSSDVSVTPAAGSVFESRPFV